MKNTFFEDKSRDQNKRVKQKLKKWNDLHVYAIDGITVHIIKIKNPKTGEWDAIANSLLLKYIKEKNIRKL